MNIRIAVLILVALVAGLMVISCSGKEESTPSGQMAAVVDSVASADGSMIHYKVMGQGEPTLVFVHCWECNMTYWDNQDDVFARDHRVVLLDLAGHGTSGTNRQNYTLSAYGQDVAAVVNKLGPGKIILIGHSMGGPVNIEAARLLGDRVIALIGVDTYTDMDYVYPENQLRQWLTSMETDFYGTTMGFIKNMFRDTSKASLADKIANDLASASPEVGISSMKNIAAYDYIAALKDVTAPFYLISSDVYAVDTVTGGKYTSGFNVKIINNVGHFLQIEKPEEFNRLLEETIEKITSS